MMPLERTLRRILDKVFAPVTRSIQSLERTIETNSILSAKTMIREMLGRENSASLREVEFKVFSQWGEDGIIQYLLSRTTPRNKAFIEFGVGDYRESNTRFLLLNDAWKGLVIDSSSENIGKIRKSDDYWRYDLTAVNAFITRDNINYLIGKSVV